MARIAHRPKLTRDTLLLLTGIGMAIYMMVADKVEPSLVLLIGGWTLSSVTLRVDEAIGKAKAKAAGREAP